MSKKISKSNANETLLRVRLGEIHMSAHERRRAEVSLARAEAFADAVGEIVNLVKRLTKILVVRPYQRLTTSF